MIEQLYKGCYRTGWKIKNLVLDAKRSFVFYIVALQLASILIVSGKGAGQIYLDMFLILLTITLTTYFLTKVHGGNIKIGIYTIVLLTIGTMLQSIFRQEAVLANPENWVLKNPAAGLQVQYIIAFAGAIGAGFLYKKGKFLAKPKVVKAMFASSIALYVITLVLAKAVGSVKNWIVIGGFSIQTSEINKLLYLFILSGILGGVEKPSKKRIGFAFIVTLTNLFFLTLQSEFGTMLLILTVFPVYLLLFVPDIKVVIATVLGFLGIGAGAAVVGNFISAQAAAHQAFGSLSIVQFFLRNYDKIANRFIYWLHPEKDPLGLGYQMLKAKEAILLGGWFGTESVTNLPVKTSDMVFPALIERCGIIIAVLVLIVIIMLWLEGIRVFIRKKDRYHQAICAGCVFMLFYQALIIVAGSCGMCPLTGITLPFISSGGSSLLVSAVMIGIIITISGNVGWEGEMDHEEMELEFKLFKKDSDYTEHFTSLCHRYGAVLNQNFSRLAGRFKRSGSGEGQSDTDETIERICEGTDSGPEGETLASSEEPLGKRTYTQPKAFSSLLGYWSKIYSTGGLEKTLNDKLALSECEKKGKKTGSTVKLTVDSGLQTKAYNAIADYKGSAVVLDAKTGEILALTSSPSFNANKIDENWEKLMDTEGIFTSNAYQNAVIPGSVFKLVTSAAIIEGQLEDEVVHDNGSLKVDGREIKNANGAVYGDLTFENGFVNSSNVYFMTQGLRLGADTLEQTMKKFLIGEEIPLDFTTLTSNRDFGDYSDNMIATTAFGQGNTLITPLHMAMIAQSIANEGEMMKPYVISSITNGKGEETDKGEKEVLTNPVSKETADKIKNAMVKAGEKYGMMTLENGGKIAAKTGTAQRGNGTNNAWMVSFAPAENPKYVVCMNQLESKEYGVSLKEEVESIYNYLFSKLED